MPVLAEKAVEGATMIEDGQVFVAIFRPRAVGKFRISDPGASWTYPIGNAVGGKRVIVPAQVTNAWRYTDESVFSVSSQTAVASLPIG
jgi:hypothetical protein